MRNLLRLAAFRALAPDDGTSGGGASNADSPTDVVAEFDIDASADAAYEAATKEDDKGDGKEGEEEEAVADAATDAETEDPDAEDPSEEEAADLPPEGEKNDDATALPADIVDAYPMARFYTDLNAGLSDPATAAQTLRWLAEETASSHGTTVEAMLGLSAPASAESTAAKGDSDAEDWAARGFASKEDFDAAPDWEKAGYDSAGEFRLAKELAELRESLKPVVDDREAQNKTSAEAKAKTEWEGAIGKIAPSAISAVKAELGWEATPEQALEAARRFPELASRKGGLKEAIVAAHARDIAKAAGVRGRGEKPKPPELPAGERRGGPRELTDDERTDVQKLADRAYEMASSS